MTGYLRVVIEQARPYDVAIPVVSELLESASTDQVVDLASGAGGPWHQIFPLLAEKHPSLRVLLTDLHPNARALAGPDSPDGVEYLIESVSAEEVPGRLGGVRTMFTGLHHFDRGQVRSILSAAQRDRVPFAAFEATQRSVRGVLVTLLIPVLVLFLMPRVQPRRPVALVLTYLPPLLPLLIWWDGFASTLRTHSADELRALVAEIASPDYAWQVEEVSVRGAPIPVLQLTGKPEAR